MGHLYHGYVSHNQRVYIDMYVDVDPLQHAPKKGLLRNKLLSSATPLVIPKLLGLDPKPWLPMCFTSKCLL